MSEVVDNEYFSKDDVEKRKKAIFDSMGKRSQKAIMKRGYDNWNPFEEPKDPIEIRKDRLGNTVAGIADGFFMAHPEKKENNAYRKVVEEMALGVVTGDDRVRASYLFAMWYKELLAEAGIEDDWA